MGYGALASKAISGIGGAVAGGLGAGQSNALRSQIIGAYSSLPTSPNLPQAFTGGYYQQEAATPNAAGLNAYLSSKYGQQGLTSASDAYYNTLPMFAAGNQKALDTVNPEFTSLYRQLGKSVSGELSAGTSLTPQEQQQDEGYIRGAEADRGNVFGNAPAAAEGLYLGNAGQQLLQQRQGDAESYLGGASPESQYADLAGAAGPAISAGETSMTAPYQYNQAPTNWASGLEGATQTQFENSDTNALAKAAAIASAPVESNPFIASLIGAGNALAGPGGSGGNQFGAYSGGGSGGGTSLFGGGSGSGAGYGGTYAPSSSFGSTEGQGEYASPTYL